MRINGKKITAIASDFDGTIIKHGAAEPTELFYKLINTCLEQDIFFIAASGRQYPNLYRLLHHLNREIAYICENGSLVMYRGEVVYKAIIEETTAWELLTDMLGDIQKGYDCDIMVSGQENSYFLDSNPSFAEHVEKNLGNRGKVLKDFHEVEEPMIKISLYFSKGIPEELTVRYHEKYDSHLQVVDAGNDWFDFMPLNGSKGHALKVLADKLGICLDETVSFGDGENDISLLQATGMSFAMEGAKHNVKVAADCICECVEDVIEYGLQQEDKPRVDKLQGEAGMGYETKY